MTPLDQAEALVYKKEYAAAKALCLKLKQQGDGSLRLEFLLGSIALNMQDYPAALETFRRLRKSHPNHAGVLNNLGAALQYTGGDLEEAQALIERSLVIDPKNIPALVNLGELYLLRKRNDKARETYARIEQIAPGNPQGPFGQAMCDLAMNDFPKAFDRLEAAVKLAPHHPAILANLLHAATQTQRHDRAVEIARLIASREELKAQTPMAWAILKRYCVWDEAAALLPRVLEILLAKETLPEQFTPIALEILSSPDIDHATLKRLHVQCGDGLRLRNRGFPAPDLTKAYAPAGRMRIGYLSGDFRNHVAALFIRGVIDQHDPNRFEIFLYSSAPVGSQDEMTGRFFRVAEHFVHCHDMDDGELARRIAADGIHILVEMSGYTSHTRTPALALKPAPIQVTYIGYPATYGMREVDYILSTRELTGSDHAAAFVEESLELPELYAVSPSPDVVTRAAELPCLSNGYITFGSLINPYKINPQTIALWARVMREAAHSRIYLNHPAYASQEARRNLLDGFARHGIPAERVAVTHERPPEGQFHYIFYDKIDIVLDATPMTGGAGTSDALTVGVPVVSRVGSIFHERLSAAAIRANTPDPETYIAESDEAFVAKAIKLAADPARLAELRKLIRQAILTGPNSQSQAFTRQLEATYRNGWDRKHPQQPIDGIVSWTPPTEVVPVGGLNIEFLSRRNDLHRFVAKDTGRWFEHECDFVAHHAAELGTLLDISHDPGLAVLPIAAALPETGHLYCRRDASHGSALLARNFAANRLADRASVCAGCDTVPPPTLVRIAAECNDAQASVVRELFEQCGFAPALLLVPLESPHGPERATVDYLLQRGYACFRHHPGSHALIAASSGDPQDSFARNLFCVLTEAVPLLQEHGMIAASGALDLLPDSLSEAWRRHARSPARAPKAAFDPVYLAALNAYARSQDDALPPDERLRQFAFAELLLGQLALTESTVPRLFGLIRLKAAAGKRDEAVELARRLADALADKNGPVLDEPFLLPVDTAADLPLADADEAVWSHSVALIALERLRSWSPFFTAAESTTLWKELASLPWCADLAKSKLALLGSLWEVFDEP